MLREYKVIDREKLDSWIEHIEFQFGELSRNECRFKGANFLINDELYQMSKEVLDKCIEPLNKD